MNDEIIYLNAPGRTFVAVCASDFLYVQYFAGWNPQQKAKSLKVLRKISKVFTLSILLVT